MKGVHNIIKAMTFVFLISIIACAGVKVIHVETDQSVDIKSYKTYKFYEMEIQNETDLEPQKENLELILNAVNQELKAKNLTKVEENPDLMVNIGIVITEEIKTRSTTIDEAPAYIGQRNYHWESEEVEVGRYNRGSVAVDLVDSKQNKLIWHVVARSVIDEKQEKNASKIKEGISKIFEKFPD